LPCFFLAATIFPSWDKCHISIFQVLLQPQNVDTHHHYSSIAGHAPQPGVQLAMKSPPRKKEQDTEE